MISRQLYLPIDLYTDYLVNLSDINFTRREIDILACLLSARGTSKIAHFLCISPKTVVTHIRNIMFKLDCNSRERIIDFLERSGKVSMLRQHYSNLIAQSAFEKCLKGVSKLKQEAKPTCTILCSKTQSTKDPHIDSIETHLKLSGLLVNVEYREGGDFVREPRIDEFLIYALPSAEEANPQAQALLSETGESRSNGIVLFLCSKNDDPDNWGDYYLSLLEILPVILPEANLQKITHEFKDHYDPLPCKESGEHLQANRESRELGSPDSEKKTYLLSKFAVGLGILIVGCCFFYLNGGRDTSTGSQNKSQHIRSDLILPSQVTLVNRSDLIAQITNEFSNQKGIQSVAIVGIGGAGKTTLARFYAKQINSGVAWEVNAENQESLLRSFESLAYALSVAEEDKKTLTELQNIKDPIEKRDKIIFFVRERLLLHKNWLLIYDNVESCKDIEKYYPHDPTLWGTGKVLITTRNSTIQNNSQINSAVQIGELSNAQKLNLFEQILKQGGSIEFNKQAAELFLTEIPPFPLDVSLAAYYIKSTNIPYAKYLEHLKSDEESLSGLHENILNESGSYNKTRYKIITLTLKRLIAENKEFLPLFLLVSLMDSQNIPQGILERFKGDQTVSAFIYQLKKHSLIADGTLSTAAEPTFSIHRSTQKIIFDHLRFAGDNEVISSICMSMDSVATEASDQENFTKLKCLISHFKRMLECEDLIKEENWVIIAKELGWIYFYLGDYDNATSILEQCRDILIKDSKYNNSLLLAHVLKSLGATYLETKEYRKADELLNQSLTIYKHIKGENHELVASNLQLLAMRAYHRGEYAHAKELYEKAKDILTINYPHKYIAIARLTSRLGDVNRELGNYDEARKLLEESLSLYKMCLDEDHYRVGQAQARLGVVYKDIGEYGKAKELLELGLAINKKYYPNNCDKVIRLAGKLGQVEYELGHIGESLKILEECHEIYTTLYPEDFRVGWIKFYLGQVYIAKGDYERAKLIFEQSLMWHEKNYGKDHKETAQVIRTLGKLHYLQGDLETGEALLQKSLKICQASNHPQAFMDLEMLGELYSQRAQLAEKEEQAQELRRTSLSYYQQALEIITTRFPSDSPHLKRIQSAIKNLKQ